MDPLAFLYIALGVGFLLLVVFICVTLIYCIQILRDVTKISESVRDTAERVNDYVVQPFAIINQVIEHVRPIMDAVQSKRHQIENSVNDAVHDAAKNYKKRSKRSK